ncbi:MAG: type IV pilin-like G/H family protein, partial [Microcystis sp. M53603_WE2]|uniref:type IV pilin-like G/H family protein n=1 Tax=Microcystis sp. M53603_WE2 TaxID=3030678 RepID=UPI0025898C0F
MRKPNRHFSLAFLVSSLALLATGNLTLSQTGNSIAQDQNAALQAVAKMTEGQRTYYQNNGNFRAKVDNVQDDFGVTLPKTFDYAIRTTSEAAYSYVIPARSTVSNQLKAYVGAAFITPNQDPKITTIICQNTNPGPAIPNSNGSVGYRIDFASVPQNRVNELPIGFCRNGSPRFEFYRDAEL